MKNQHDIFQKNFINEKNRHFSAIIIVAIFIITLNMGSLYCSLLISLCHCVIFNELLLASKKDTKESILRFTLFLQFALVYSKGFINNTNI
jgi:CDP-diglyceride synthetase